MRRQSMESQAANAVAKCDLCLYPCENPSALAKHLVEIHPGQNFFKCGECGDRFTALHGLKNHMRGHRGCKIYECGLCGKMFVQPDNLREHVQSHAIRKYVIHQ
ncbi:unnamed protein product [Meganyctiphanes norvegica]|uniref:C2H2-type domain-containing protein n=1 Tax=Meganyctiphanes norvegica TaxID=48144 RepID=A0AAV2QBA5_MEGNR